MAGETERLRLAQAYREQQQSLTGLLVSEIRDLLGTVLGGRRPDPADASDLTSIVAPIVGQYGSAGVSLASDFYERQREAARLTQGFQIRPTDPVSDGVIARSVSWALQRDQDRQAQAREDLARLREQREQAVRDAEANAGTRTADPDEDLIDLDAVTPSDNLDDIWQTDLEGALSRHANAPARHTLEDAIDDDPESVAWIRITDGAPCGFCAMCASRGFTYTSRETALYIEGTREPYHDHCGCTTMPRFRTDSSPLPKLNQELQDLWYSGPAYFSNEDARSAMERAVRAKRAGRDVQKAVFEGPRNDPDKYRRQVTHDKATVEEFRRRAQRGGRNGRDPNGPDAPGDPRFR